MFTFEELSDIHLTYGEMHCNALAARRRYAQKFPNRRLSAPTFVAVDRRAHETGSLCRHLHMTGRPRIAHLDERVLAAVNTNSRTSTRRIAAELHASQRTVNRVLNRERLYAYHYQPVQALLPLDRPAPRLQYCQWLLGQLAPCVPFECVVYR